MRYGQHSYSLAQLRKLRRLAKEEGERSYTRADDGKFSETAGSGGDSAAAAEEPAAEEEAPVERAPAEEREAALAAAGLDPNVAMAFDELAVGIADGEDIGLSPENKQALIDAGLVTPREGSDWAVDLTDTGKALAEASAKGDTAGAAAAVSGGAAASAEGEAEESAAGGGGGGSSTEPDPEVQAELTAIAAEQAGIAPGGVDAMRAAAKGEAIDPKAAEGLVTSGLMAATPEGPQLTPEGRKALAALEEGNVEGVVAASQDAKAKRRAADARAKAKAEGEQRRQAATATREKAKADREAARAAKEREKVERAQAKTKQARSATMHAFVPFDEGLAKAAGAEAQIVYGVASTAIVDDQPGVWEGERYEGDVVDPGAIRAALDSYWGNIREMHDEGPPTAAGTALDVLTADDGRTYLVAKIVDGGAWDKVRRKVYKGFSIGGRVLKAVLERLPDGRVIRRIVKLLLTEISLVDRPANPEAAILIFKRSTMGAENETEAPEQPTGDPLAAVAVIAKAADPTKVVQQIQLLRNEAELAGDLEGAERYTQAIGLLLIGAGEADDPMGDEEEGDEETTDEVAMAEAPPEDDEVAMATGPVAMAATAQVRKVGRKIAGSRMKVMKDAVLAYLKVLEEAGDTDATAMLKAVSGSTPPLDTKALAGELQKALSAPLETIAQAVLRIHGDVEAIKAQPAGGGPVARFAGQPVTKRLAGQPAQIVEPAAAPDPSYVARLRQLIATETRPQLREQYVAELKQLTA
jgi:hypothetical protein